MGTGEPYHTATQSFSGALSTWTGKFHLLENIATGPPLEQDL